MSSPWVEVRKNAHQTPAGARGARAVQPVPARRGAAAAVGLGRVRLAAVVGLVPLVVGRAPDLLLLLGEEEGPLRRAHCKAGRRLQSGAAEDWGAQR